MEEQYRGENDGVELRVLKELILEAYDTIYSMYEEAELAEKSEKQRVSRVEEVCDFLANEIVAVDEVRRRMSIVVELSKKK